MKLMRKNHQNILRYQHFPVEVLVESTKNPIDIILAINQELNDYVHLCDDGLIRELYQEQGEPSPEWYAGEGVYNSANKKIWEWGDMAVDLGDFTLEIEY